MSSGEGCPLGAGDALSTLDQAAGQVIEARALVMTLPADKREELRVLTDLLLAALGRRIAAELPQAALRGDASDRAHTT